MNGATVIGTHKGTPSRPDGRDITPTPSEAATLLTLR
jgi:hypothetical protein